MLSGKQTTARKMTDHLRNCINQRAHGFGFTVTAYILRAQYELMTL